MRVSIQKNRGSVRFNVEVIVLENGSNSILKCNRLSNEYASVLNQTIFISQFLVQISLLSYTMWSHSDKQKGGVDVEGYILCGFKVEDNICQKQIGLQG